MQKGQGHGGARRDAGRKTKTPYVKRKPASWNVEEWIPKALQQLARSRGIDPASKTGKWLVSSSDIVNEALRALCILFGYQSLEWSTHRPDPYKTARWRFFSDAEMAEVHAALSQRWKEQGHPKTGALHDVWLSSWQAFEPQGDVTSWRGSILDAPAPIPAALPVPASEALPGIEEGERITEAAETASGIDFDTIETQLRSFEQLLEQPDDENEADNETDNENL